MGKNNEGGELCFPKTGGNVLKSVVGQLFVEPLVGGFVFQTAEMGDIRANLDVVEIGLVDFRRDDGPSTIPCGSEARIVFVNIDGKLVDGFRLGIASHESDAGDVSPELLDELVDDRGCERTARVAPEIFAVAPWAATWAVGDVNGECHLIRNFLKDDTRVHVFKHRF